MVEQKIKLKNIEINYKHFANHKKPVFLILHGWAGSSDSWEKVCDILKNDCEIYAFDFPFFGKSDDLKKIWKVDDYVELVEEFIRVRNLEPLQINIIAHSFGGRVAIKLAAKNPEWLEKIFLCDSAGIKHPPAIKQKIARIIAKAGKKIFHNKQPRHSLQKNSLAFGYRSAQALAHRNGGMRRLFYRLFGTSDYYNCKNEIMRETFKNVIAEDLTPYLSKIKKPAVIIWGDKDKYTPLKDGEIMNEKIKNSELRIIKGIGHGIHLFAPDKVCEIIKKTLL